MKMEMKLEGLDGVIATLHALPAEVVSKRGGPVKLALAKGARLLRDQARANLKRSIAFNGSESTGLLERSVIASRGKGIFKGKGERYLVRVKRKAYDLQKITKSESFNQVKGGKGKRVTTLLTANLLEYGSSTQPARPWLRPAVQRRGSQIIDVVTEDLLKRLESTIKRLASKSRKSRGAP